MKDFMKSRPSLRNLLSKPKLMIAHSDHDLLEEMVLGLEQFGFHVRTSNSGIGCVEKMRNSPTDVLLLDPDLLWGGGDGVLDLLAESPELGHIRVLLLVSQGATSSNTDKLKKLVGEVLTLPSLSETVAERCIELAESTNIRNLRPAVTTWPQPS